MKIGQLKVSKKARFNIKKPENIPPQSPNVSPFFVELVIAARGMGKTHSICQMLQHISHNDFYNRWISISPSYYSDIKQESTFEDIEKRGGFLELYSECNEEILNQIQEDSKYYIEQWEDYQKKRELWEKLKKKGIRKMTDDELAFLFEFIIDDEDLDRIDEDMIFGQYPDWIKRDKPPMTMIFLDDCYSSSLMSKTRNNPLINLICNGRHQLTSLIIATQSLASIPRAVRSNTSIWLLFPTKAKKDLDYLFAETANAFPSEQAFHQVMNDVSKEDHGFLYVDASSLKEPFVSITYDKPVLFDNK